MSESESEGVGWEDDSSSESKEDIELRLLRLDIEERSESLESLSLIGGMKASMDMSCKYLERRARLKERSTSSSSSSSLRRRGRSGMITHKKKHNIRRRDDDEHTGGSETQKAGDADTMPTGHRDEGDHYFAHY